ncbi:helix-turn-helix domain-containing protein [Lachnospiraceae bacterium OttesenSCG-928-D06]|nr:helix-turn-helix domain-containing protein [Lachnospiraceae bacterium OttesenSCG-928-D06]
MAEKLREIREEHNLGPIDMAEMLGIEEEKTYLDYESGKSFIPLKTIIDVSFIFNLSIDYILGNIENPKKDSTQCISLKGLEDEVREYFITLTKDNIRNNISEGNVLKQLREINGHTHEELCEKLSIPLRTYKRHEKIPDGFTVKNIQKLASHYKKSIDYILQNELDPYIKETDCLCMYGCSKAFKQNISPLIQMYKKI